MFGIRASFARLLMIFHPQGLDNFDDVHGDGALHKAPSAANAGVKPFVIGGIVDQLMHEALTEPLLLGETGVAAGHLGEIGIHTGVPAAEPLDAVSGVKVPDVVALAGGADKGAAAAA